MFRLLATLGIWLLWFGGAALIMHLDARQLRRKAMAEHGEDFADRRIMPYMLLAVLCGALPVVIYFGATRKGARGVLLGLGVLLAHTAVLVVIGAPLYAGASWLDARPASAPALPSNATGTLASGKSLPPPGGSPLTGPPADLAQLDLSVALDEADMVAIASPQATRMRAALGRLAARCAAGKDQVTGAVPADITSGLESDAKVVETAAECEPSSGNGFAFAPLRGNARIVTTATIYTVRLTSGPSMDLMCPSEWSDDPRAVDLRVEHQASGLTSKLLVTVMAEKACLSPKRIEQERKKNEWLRSVVEPFRERFDDLVTRASCPAAMDQFAGGPSPAKSTSLEADGRVLQVKVTCWWDRGGYGNGLSYALLRGPTQDDPSDSGSVVWTLRAGQGRAYKVVYPSTRSKDALDISFEQPLGPTHKVAIELAASVK